MFENFGISIREKVWLETSLSQLAQASHPSYLSAYVDVTECSETSAYKIQTTGNCSEESIKQ